MIEIRVNEEQGFWVVKASKHCHGFLCPKLKDTVNCLRWRIPANRFAALVISHEDGTVERQVLRGDGPVYAPLRR